MAGPSGQPAPRFSPWQGSLVMSRGGHGLWCQDRPGLAWPGAGRKGASDGQPGVGIPGARRVIPVLGALGLVHTHFAFCLVLPSQDRNTLAG